MNRQAQANRSGLSRELFERFKDATYREQWKGVKAAYLAAHEQGKSGLLAAYDHIRRDCPHLLGHLSGEWRKGREDFLNILMGFSLTREPGAVGEPTSQMVTTALTDKTVDKTKDLIELTPANDRQRDGREGRD